MSHSIECSIIDAIKAKGFGQIRTKKAARQPVVPDCSL
jgi:hypothetical protein